MHMVDDATHFSAAHFFELPTTESGWETILTLFEIVYTSFPNTLVFDCGSKLRDIIVEICEIHDVELQRSGAQYHSTLCIGEICHEPISCAFRKL